MKCLQYGSEDIVEGVRVMDENKYQRGDLQLEVYENPDAMIFKGAMNASLSTNVCVGCDFVMFYVTPQAAKEIKILRDR